MMKNLKRREAMKVAALAGGLLTLGSVASGASRDEGKQFAGNWLCEGQSCAIFQQGPILLLVNEQGSLATARVTEPGALVVLQGEWEHGLTAGLANRGRELKWSNASVWKRA